jgi:hypothetical protein
VNLLDGGVCWHPEIFMRIMVERHRHKAIVRAPAGCSARAVPVSESWPLLGWAPRSQGGAVSLSRRPWREWTFVSLRTGPVMESAKRRAHPRSRWIKR